MNPPAARKVATPHDAYPLRTVTTMTGLSADLIRAWEKRYKVVSPVRGARGARLYSAADIAHLRLLGQVVGSGRAIGDVAAMSFSQLEVLAARGAAAGDTARTQHARRDSLVDRVLALLGQFDQVEVARLLGDALVALGPRAFVHEVAVAIIARVGTGWAAGHVSIGEEHLFTATLRTLLSALMQNRTRAGRPVLLATPSGERHEIGLMLVALLALEAGANVVYLGVDVPAVDIAEAARRTQARVVGMSVVTAENRAAAVRQVKALCKAVPVTIEVWLGGGDAAEVAARARNVRVRVVTNLRAAEDELGRVVATGRA
jgi:methanogenic corrinoid protein MtbC1